MEHDERQSEHNADCHQNCAHLLRKAQKENHVNTCQDLQHRLEGDPEFLLKIIIYEEMQDYKYNAETKQHK
jgi:hypothetical protein